MAILQSFVACLLALVPMSAGAQSQALARNRTVVFQSSEKQIALLELFTSEGCSSCPPAEKWLSGLKKSTALWKEFVAVSFHVDYWDRLGWRDPWASRTFSDRQRAYAASWKSTIVYTPGFVLNGKEWRPWPRPKDGPRSAGGTPGVLKVVSGDRVRWQVRFTPANRTGGWYEAHAALLANDLTSDVKAGENRGRRLNHDFVVTALTKCGLKPQRDFVWGEFILNKAAKSPTDGLALAVWVTKSGSLEALQAVGGWLR